jgi:hypothetical protein
MPNSIVNIERNGGFGVSVLQRLCKTSIKKNLYYEIKEKVIEEAFNGIRMAKKSQKVRVYGLDSTHDVRERLIEILYERVRYHKDKFVARVIKEEMAGMQVKRNGKVEHSDQTHDDQVFSYLIALYVWYEGKNLMDNWHIQKTTIKTDEDIDFEDNFITNYDANLEQLPLDEATRDADESDEIMETLEWIEQNSKYITAQMMYDSQKKELHQLRESILSNNEAARNAYARETGVEPEMLINNEYVQNQVEIPDYVFGTEDDDFYFEDNDDDDYSYMGYANGNAMNSYYQGNLSYMMRNS